MAQARAFTTPSCGNGRAEDTGRWLSSTGAHKGSLGGLLHSTSCMMPACQLLRILLFHSIAEKGSSRKLSGTERSGTERSQAEGSIPFWEAEPSFRLAYFLRAGPTAAASGANAGYAATPHHGAGALSATHATVTGICLQVD